MIPWSRLGILIPEDLSGYAVLCLLADGQKPISARAITRNKPGCHPLQPHLSFPGELVGGDENEYACHLPLEE